LPKRTPQGTGDTGPTPTGFVHKRLVDPPPVKCNPNNSPEVDSGNISGMILAGRAVLKFSRNRPKRQPEHFLSKPGPVLKRLVDPPPIKCKPNIFPEADSEQEALGHGCFLQSRNAESVVVTSLFYSYLLLGFLTFSIGTCYSMLTFLFFDGDAKVVFY
jgi:hypothetical protein